MSGNVDINFTAQENDLYKAQAKVIKQQEEMIEKYKKLGTEAKKGSKDAEKATAAAAKEMDRFAKATTQINRTPLEKYADQMRQLDIALKAGKIDQETFNRAVGQAKTEFQKAGEASHKAFGSSSLANLASYAAGLGTIAAAAAAAKRVLSEVQAEADAAGQKQFEQAPSLGMLAQVADSPEDLQRLVGEAQKTFAEGGARSIPEAAKLQFALESGGVGNLRGDFSRMQASGLVPDASMMAEAAIKLTAGMGAKETGDFRTVISKAFGGAKKGLGSAEELLQATASVSSQSSRLGLTDEETMAAVSTGSAVVGPAEAATQMEALMKGIEVEGIGGGFLKPGKTLMEQVARLKEQVAAGEDIREMLGGRQEAIKGFGMLSSAEGQAAMQENLANIATAEREDWFGQKVEMAGSIPVNAAAMIARKRANRAELDTQEIGMYENVADAVAADQKEFKRQQYGGGRLGDLAAAGEGVGIGIHRWLTGNREFIQSGLNAGVSQETQAAAQSIGMTIGQAAAQEISGAGANVERNLTNAARANQAAAGGAVEAR